MRTCMLIQEVINHGSSQEKNISCKKDEEKIQRMEARDPH